MMVRVIAVLAVLAGLGGVALLALSPERETPRSSEDPPLVTAIFGPLPGPSVPEPEVKFARTMYAAAPLESSIPLIDDCRGPVAVDVGAGSPVLVSEHDYCGGSEWISQLALDDTVALDGDGIDDGTYAVAELKYMERGNVFVHDMPPGDLVLQTCVSATTLVLVAVERVDT